MSTLAPITLTTDTIAVLPQHRFDEMRLTEYLRAHVEGFTAPLTVTQTQGGMSNPTFILTDGTGKRYVMRKKPPGKLLPSAHAVDREFRVISALAGTGVPVAKAYVLCQDSSVIGTDFYIMDFIDGRVLRLQTLPALVPAERRKIYEAMVDTLATLHKLISVPSDSKTMDALVAILLVRSHAGRNNTKPAKPTTWPRWTASSSGCLVIYRRTMRRRSLTAISAWKT